MLKLFKTRFGFYTSMVYKMTFYHEVFKKTKGLTLPRKKKEIKLQLTLKSMRYSIYIDVRTSFYLDSAAGMLSRA